MLAVKLLEMTANPALRLESGAPKDSIVLALFLGWASVFGFTLWLYVQGSAMHVPTLPLRASDVPGPLTDSQIECISRSKTNEETLACTQ